MDITNYLRVFFLNNPNSKKGLQIKNHKSEIHFIGPIGRHTKIPRKFFSDLYNSELKKNILIKTTPLIPSNIKIIFKNFLLDPNNPEELEFVKSLKLIYGPESVNPCYMAKFGQYNFQNKTKIGWFIGDKINF